MKKQHILLVLFLIITSIVNAQFCGFAPGFGCDNTNYNNYGVHSNGDASTIEYDNFLSSFHSSIVREYTGTFLAWGQNTSPTGGHLNTATPIVPPMYNYTGTGLKAALGSNDPNMQHILLTTTGLYAWGGAGAVVSTSVKSGNAFGPFNASVGMPPSVSPTDVKMMFATNQTLALVTCDGRAWVLSQRLQLRGSGSGATSSTTWYPVKLNADDTLTNIIALRGTYHNLIALTDDGTDQNLYVWGLNSYLGDSTSPANRSYATLMTKPSTTGTIKMIGATTQGSYSYSSYYVLYSDGNLYSLGFNEQRQLGDWTTTNRTSWVRPRYSSGGSVMDDIVWISPNEHDRQFASINVINNKHHLWNWGAESAYHLGRHMHSGTGGSTALNPGMPIDLFNPGVDTAKITAVETGGHTTMHLRECESNFGYVGHKVNGSMADGTNTDNTIQHYTYNTDEALACGANPVPVIYHEGVIEIGDNGKICNTSEINLYPFPEPTTSNNGVLSVVSGPGSLTGNVLTFTGTTPSTVTVEYSVETDCGAPYVTTRTFEIEDCGPLPLTLISFKGKYENGQVFLNWETASEINNKGFEIERSTDGRNWTTIGFINSKADGGNSSDKLNYSFTDNAPISEQNFYRLKQVDFDGKYEYSPVRMVSFDKGNNISIYPNPTKDNFTISGLKGNENIKVYDVSGRLIHQVNAANTSVTVPLDKLSEGVYHISIISKDGNVSSHKVLKNN